MLMHDGKSVFKQWEWKKVCLTNMGKFKIAGYEKAPMNLWSMIVGPVLDCILVASITLIGSFDTIGNGDKCCFDSKN